MSPNKRNKTLINRHINNDLPAGGTNKCTKKPIIYQASRKFPGFLSYGEFKTNYFYIREIWGCIAIHTINDDGDISVHGFNIEGFVPNSFCTSCNHIRLFDIDHDSYFCPLCNNWHDKACNDPDCRFCSTRPVKPLPDFIGNADNYPERSGGGWGRYTFIGISV